MSKKVAIFSIFVLMLVFLIFGIVNVAMGRTSLFTSKLNGNKKVYNLIQDNEPRKNGLDSETKKAVINF